jgi:hypothetical protein
MAPEWVLLLEAPRGVTFCSGTFTAAAVAVNVVIAYTHTDRWRYQAWSDEKTTYMLWKWPG